MSKSHLARGISSLLNGNNVPPADTSKGKSIMALLHDKEPEPTDNKLVTNAENDQPVLINDLLNQEFIKELNIITGRPTYDIPIDIIFNYDSNFREELGEIISLARSILANGLQFPLTVVLVRLEDGKIIAQLLDGKRRLAAFKWLVSEGHNIKTAQCFIGDPNMTELEKIKLMFVSQDNKQFEPLEMAEGFRRMKIEDPKLSAEKIAIIIGKSDKYVRDIMMLLDESDQIRQLIKEGKILYTPVVELRRSEPDAEKRLQIILEKIEQTGTFTTADVRTRKAKKAKETTEVESHIEESGKAILGEELWKFGNIIQEIKKGDVSARIIREKISILQEQPNNPISVYARLELFTNHLSLFYSDDIREKFKIIIQFLYGEITEEDLLKIAEELGVEKNENE